MSSRSLPEHAQEAPLPYTPSNTARRSQVGYLGFHGVGFNDLWPLFAGAVASSVLSLRFFVAEPVHGSWLWKTVLAAAPLAAGFAYLKFLVVGRPPHFKGDLWSNLTGLRLNFVDPPFRSLPILPRLTMRTTAACGPLRAAEAEHPMSARRRLHGPHVSHRVV